LLTDQPAVIDTCVLINLLATNRIEEIVEVISPHRLVCPAVFQESLYLRSAEPTGQPAAVDLNPLFDQGIFTRCAIQGDLEEELYVGYALELDDGEAMSIAIAQARNLALATDEKKARRVIQENVPTLSLLSTPQILHTWAQAREQAEIVTVIGLIHARASFRPSPTDPFAAWWETVLQP
jgi:predicted nucleic acid-binding protein